MAETNARVMDMVRKEIEKDPSVASEALYEKAKKVDRSIGDLSVRQFHARYPLQVKRARANARKRRGGTAAAKKAGRGAAKKAAKRPGRPRGRPRGRPPTKKTAARKTAAPVKQGRRRGRPPGTGKLQRRSGGTGTDAVRGLLLQFARDVAAAEGKADVVDVIGGVDGWVDRLIAAAK